MSFRAGMRSGSVVAAEAKAMMVEEMGGEGHMPAPVGPVVVKPAPVDYVTMAADIEKAEAKKARAQKLVENNSQIARELYHISFNSRLNSRQRATIRKASVSLNRTLRMDYSLASR